MSFKEFRDALSSHWGYYTSSPVVREVVRDVIRTSPYWGSPIRVSPYRTYLSTSVYRSPYREPNLYRSYVSPYRSYYPYYSPSWLVNLDWSYESPSKFRSPQRTTYYKNLDMPYAQHPDVIQKEEKKEEQTQEPIAKYKWIVDLEGTEEARLSDPPELWDLELQKILVDNESRDS